MASTTSEHIQRPGLIFTLWCAGNSRHERLARKHVPDSDPGCAHQSPSIPALHRRNAPNCRPMAEGGMRKCSAGACPPLGSGRGVAESAVPIRCTKPQLRLFIPWCAGTNRDERLVRRPALRTTSMPALHRRNLRNCRVMVDGRMRKCSAGACPPLGSGWGRAESTVPTRRTKPRLVLFHSFVRRRKPAGSASASGRFHLPLISFARYKRISTQSQRSCGAQTPAKQSEAS